ncbi:hypothetical protein GCM10010278_76740 [Streptomyces melanogenes]|nr:hypothetical protein GCM10010278_76740 [Streptomyces melanogenes]
MFDDTEGSEDVVLSYGAPTRGSTREPETVMPLIAFTKRVVAVMALTAAVPGIGAAPAVAAGAPLGQCAVSVSNPNHAGNYVWAETSWNCSTLPADGGAKVHLRITATVPW